MQAENMQIGTNGKCNYSSISSDTSSNEDRHRRDHNEKSPSVRMEHLGASRQYWRDMILGVNDGLISTFLLVVGVGGGGLSSRDILLTGIAGALAGAVSMCAGEYVATKSQNEVIHGELALEKTHVHHFMEEELAELGELMDLIGITHEQEQLRKNMLDFYAGHPEALLQIMKALEFGVLDSEIRSPIRAGLFSGVLFTFGSLPSIIPFVFSGDSPGTGLMLATVLSVASLLLVGAVKTWATRTPWLSAAVENLVIAGFGGAFAYGVGVLFDIVAS